MPPRAYRRQSELCRSAGTNAACGGVSARRLGLEELGRAREAFAVVDAALLDHAMRLLAAVDLGDLDRPAHGVGRELVRKEVVLQALDLRRRELGEIGELAEGDV